MITETMIVNNRLIRFSHKSAYLDVINCSYWKNTVSDKIDRYNDMYDFDYYLYVTWEDIYIKRHDPQNITDFPLY
jgi:hypothetical protein